MWVNDIGGKVCAADLAPSTSPVTSALHTWINGVTKSASMYFLLTIPACTSIYMGISQPEMLCAVSGKLYTT